MLHAVLLAGGSGTRLWPASRKKRPKQVAPIAGSASLLENTLARLEGLVPQDRTWILATRDQREVIGAHVPDFHQERLIFEPAGRDTAAAIGLGATLLAAEDPDAVMLVLPSDHWVQPKETFRQQVRTAVGLAEETDGLVTFGIPPRHPATGYGYIEEGELASVESPPAFRVKRFREKPDKKTAQGYLDSGKFYWNSGMFAWKASAILREIEQHLPQHGKALKKIASARGTSEFNRILQEEYETIPRISIDYGVLEKAAAEGKVYMIPATFDWNDVGVWSSVASLLEEAEGNTARGLHVGIDSSGNLVIAEEGHLVSTIGVRDCVIVQTADATLVCARDRDQQVKELVEQLEKKGLHKYL